MLGSEIQNGIFTTTKTMNESIYQWEQYERLNNHHATIVVLIHVYFLARKVTI